VLRALCVNGFTVPSFDPFFIGVFVISGLSLALDLPSFRNYHSGFLLSGAIFGSLTAAFNGFVPFFAGFFFIFFISSAFWFCPLGLYKGRVHVLCQTALDCP
jgi:hypothetical protein